MTKLGHGFEQFKNLGECIEGVKQLACHYPGNGPAYYDVTGTPAESLFGVKGQMYNGCEYDFTGWGADRATPWGPLPNRIIAIRSDLAKLIRGTTVASKHIDCCVHCGGGWCGNSGESVRACDGKHPEWECYEAPCKPQSAHKPLIGPDWKPAPGFERPW